TGQRWRGRYRRFGGQFCAAEESWQRPRGFGRQHVCNIYFAVPSKGPLRTRLRTTYTMQMNLKSVSGNCASSVAAAVRRRTYPENRTLLRLLTSAATIFEARSKIVFLSLFFFGCWEVAAQVPGALDQVDAAQHRATAEHPESPGGRDAVT